MLTHPLMRKIDSTSISNAAERVGYELYIPETLVFHLATSILFHVSHGEPKKFITEKSAYTEALKSLIDLLNYDRFDVYDPLGCALLLLKLACKHVDLRKIEKAANTGESFSIDPKGTYKNYPIDLYSIPEIVLDLLEVHSDDLSQAELSEDVLKVLGFYNGIHKKPGTIIDIKTREYARLSKFKEVTSIRKYKYSLPTFKADLALKKHIIKKTKIIQEDNNDIVLAIDCSLGSDERELLLLKKAVLLHYISIFDENSSITYHEFSRNVLNTNIITSRQELISLFKQPLTRRLSLSRDTNALSQLGSIHEGKDIMIITTGNPTFTLNRNRGNKFHAVTYNSNNSLCTICVETRGNYKLF